MDVSVIHNSDQPLGELMRDELETADEFCASSAFLNSGGLEYVLSNMHRILEAEGSVRVIHGADFRITDPPAIRKLIETERTPSEDELQSAPRLGFDHEPQLPPKLYLWTANYNSYTAVVGSSNLALGGLLNNIEVNTVMRGEISERPITQCLRIFQKMIAQPNLIEPGYEFLAKYQELHDHARELPFKSAPTGDMQALYRELEELIRPPSHDWRPRTQLEFVIKALQNLEEQNPDENLLRDAGESFIHLGAIYPEVVRLAREAGKEYDWLAIESSIRGRINENILNPHEGGSYFVRAGNMSGRYRLSEAGKILFAGEYPLLKKLYCSI